MCKLKLMSFSPLVNKRKRVTGKGYQAEQPRKPGSLPTLGAATKTLVQAGHVTVSKIFCSVWWGKYQITFFHIQAIHFKCKERDVMVAKNNKNFLI